MYLHLIAPNVQDDITKLGGNQREDMGSCHWRNNVTSFVTSNLLQSLRPFKIFPLLRGAALVRFFPIWLN